MSPRKRYSFWINDVQAAGLKMVEEWKMLPSPSRSDRR